VASYPNIQFAREGLQRDRMLRVEAARRRRREDGSDKNSKSPNQENEKRKNPNRKDQKLNSSNCKTNFDKKTTCSLDSFDMSSRQVRRESSVLADVALHILC
jgi:hypothetical protein